MWTWKLIYRFFQKKILVVITEKKKFIMTDVSGLYILKSAEAFFMANVEQDVDHTSIHVVPATFNSQDNYNAFIKDDLPTFPFGDSCLKISHQHGERPILGTLDYFRNCAMGDDMARKTGTYDMVCAVLSFCQRLFGNECSKFGVHDATSFWCGKRRVKMWLHNLLVYGETYYERKFGAKPDESDEATTPNISGWSSIKSQLATEQVTSDLVHTLITYTKHMADTSLRDDLWTIMHNCVGNCSWKEMFRALHFAHGGEGCQFFSTNVLRYIQSFFKIKLIDKFEIELSPKHREMLVAHDKILDGDESVLVTQEQIRRHKGTL